MGVSSGSSSDPGVAVHAEVESLRRDMLPIFLAPLLVVPLLWMLHVTRANYEPMPGPLDVAVLVTIACTGLVFKWQHKHFAAACWVFAVAVTIAVNLILVAYPTPIVAAGGSLVAIVVSVLLGSRRGFLAAILVWGTIIATWYQVAHDPLTPGFAASLLVLYCIIWGANWLAGRPLRLSLEFALNESDRARVALEEVRKRRGELYRAFRALEEATYRIERMNNELLLARQEAEAARTVKARLVATVSHELRGPLNLILGFSQLMALHPERYEEPLPSTYYADIDVVYRNSQHLICLIDDILDLSRIEAERLPLVKDRIDLEEDVVKKVVEAVRPLAVRKGLHLKEDLAGNLPWILADPVRLRQALTNVLINAVRFTERGEITLRTECQEQELIVSVQDTGSGIAEKDLPKLFIEFNALSRTETREGAGTGLGLSISKQLIELHGGQIWAESMLGVGTTFHFSLPLPFAVTTAGICKTGPARPTAVSYNTCLVVHNDPNIVRMLGRYVETYRTIGVTKEQDVLKVTEEIHPRAVITTPAFSERIKREYAANAYEVPIISLNIPSLTEQQSARGVLSYLTKPVTTDMVMAIISQVDGGEEELTILLVDDDPDFVRLLEDMLTLLPHPFRILRAYSGRQALDIMQTTVPDLVFLDLMMPELSGEKTIEAMRSEPRLSDVPVIIVSAKDAIDDGIAITAPVLLHFDGPLDLAKGASLLRGLLDVVSPWYLRQPGMP